MPFFLDGEPTSSEISEAINYLLANSQQTTSTNIVNGQVTDAVGTIVSYLYKYIYVKYADSFDGTVNFSNTPTGRSYYGLRNDDSAIESTNPADYIWYQVTGGFGSTKFVFYSVTGGRRINIVVGASAPSILYQADGGSAINLDFISGSDGSSSRICYAKSTSTSLASTPTTYQTSGPSGFPPTNTWGGAETWQATPPTLATNEALFQSDGIYNPTTDLTTWNVPYLSNLRVGALSAISANLGTITAGDISVGSSPAISGTTMTGAGSHLYSDGRFISGNSTANIVFDGSNFYVNGLSAIDIQTGSFTNLIGSGEQTVITFTLAKKGKTIIKYSTNMSVRCTSAAASIIWTMTSRIKDSSGTVVPRTSYEIFSSGPPSYFGEPGYKRINLPTVYFTAVDLTPGTYTLRVIGGSNYGYDASNNFLAGTVDVIEPAANFNVFVYQVSV